MAKRNREKMIVHDVEQYLKDVGKLDYETYKNLVWEVDNLPLKYLSKTRKQRLKRLV